MEHGFLFQAFVYLTAAVVAVPVAKRLGLGAVLGYLLAGVAIGPFGLGCVGHEGESVMHFAEFGVVMMLFLVGLELRPSLLWSMRRPIFGLGGLQVAITAAAFAGIAIAAGVATRPAIAIGLVASLSSTAVVLSSLAEKGLLRTAGGQATFSVLLFQDIAVIPMLALFPLLAVEPVAASGPARPAWVQALLVVGAVGGVVAGGRWLVRPAFRWLAATRLREVLTAAALLLVVGITLLMQQVGLSPALGTFLAGVVLAESEYRHELETDIEPFKGLLLGLFFIAVGAGIDFALVVARPVAIGAMVALLVVLKGALLVALGRAFALDRPARWIFGLGLAQGGEFAFVLLAFAVTSRVLDASTAATLVAVVALSLVVAPLTFVALERVVLPRLSPSRASAEPEIEAGHDAEVIIAGFGRFGQVVGRLLRAARRPPTVLDLDPAMFETLRKVGLEVHYGDASRLDLLDKAGCARARVFVLAVDEVEKSLAIARTVRHHHPHLVILARARNRVHYYELRKLGVQTIVRETFGSAVDLGVKALEAVGLEPARARRVADRWRAHDERSLDALAAIWGIDETTFFKTARQYVEESERLLTEDEVGIDRDDPRPAPGSTGAPRA